MANATFNQAVDYFGLVTQQNTKFKVKSSAENRTKQSASGANSYGDISVVDSYGDTSAPSAEYDIIDALTEATFPALGTCATPTGASKPIVMGTVTINTSNGSAPSVSVSGQEVQTGATTLREYDLPCMSITTRHRAQDFVCTMSGTTRTPIMDIKIGANAADPVDDYGLESVSATFPVEFTLCQPQGTLVNYDLHGGTATVSYSINWYAQTAPTIELTTAATTAGYTMSSPVSKSDPENGYSQYTWTVSIPMVGEEYQQGS